MPKTYAVSLSVEYVGEGIETRSDTKYEFVQAEDVPAADALADRLAERYCTDEGGGYLSAKVSQLEEVHGTLPSFIWIHTAADIDGD